MNILKILKSELQYSVTFTNAKATVKVSRLISPIFNHKIGFHGNILERSEKEGQVGNLRSNICPMVKIVENQSSSS